MWGRSVHGARPLPLFSLEWPSKINCTARSWGVHAYGMGAPPPRNYNLCGIFKNVVERFWIFLNSFNTICPTTLYSELQVLMSVYTSFPEHFQVRKNISAAQGWRRATRLGRGVRLWPTRVKRLLPRAAAGERGRHARALSTRFVSGRIQTQPRVCRWYRFRMNCLILCLICFSCVFEQKCCCVFHYCIWRRCCLTRHCGVRVRGWYRRINVAIAQDGDWKDSALWWRSHGASLKQCCTAFHKERATKSNLTVTKLRDMCNMKQETRLADR